MLILRTGLHHEVHLFGERQIGEKEPCYEKRPAGHDEKRPSIIRLHVLSLCAGTANVNLLVLRQTFQNPDTSDLVELLVLMAGLRQVRAGP